jgi:hypothetical protein
MRVLIAALLAIAVAVSPAKAEERKTFSQAELDQALAPVALYPDALLSQVLMAATYPLEVVEAARWSRAHSGIQGDEAVRAVQDKDWDPSVKSLVAFPNLLTRMDENLEWTRRLGDAFLAQEKQVMETVQQLRQRAQAAGKLQSDERQRVDNDGGNIVIEQANPRVVYVPYYDPYVVYGPWWWPAYPPVYWGPWPGYAVGYPGFWWGVGVGVTAGFFFGSIYWPHYHVAVAYPNVYYTKPVAAYSRPYGPPPKPIQAGHWQHDTWHRHGVGERYEQRRANAMPPAGFRASGDVPGPQGRGESRAEPRGMDGHRAESRPEHRTEGSRPEQRMEGSRPQQRMDGRRPQQRMESPRPQQRAEAPRYQASAEGARPQARMPAPERMPAPSGMPASSGMPNVALRGGEFRGGAVQYRGGAVGGGFRSGGWGGYRGGGGSFGGFGGGHSGGRGRG